MIHLNVGMIVKVGSCCATVNLDIKWLIKAILSVVNQTYLIEMIMEGRCGCVTVYIYIY